VPCNSIGGQYQEKNEEHERESRSNRNGKTSRAFRQFMHGWIVWHRQLARQGHSTGFLNPVWGLPTRASPRAPGASSRSIPDNLTENGLPTQAFATASQSSASGYCASRASRSKTAIFTQLFHD